MTEWISVDERLPDAGTIVAAWAIVDVDKDLDEPHCNEHFYFFVYCGVTDGRVAWFEYRAPETYHDGEPATLDVTHWMPLPEGPK